MPTASTANLAASAGQITIDGVAFDPIAANDTVTFNDGAIGTVTAATFNSLTVTFSTKTTTAGSLTAIVHSDGVSNSAAVQVATVTPVVAASTADLAASATQITIKGLGFDPTGANNTATFNDGAAGTVTTASPTSLTVTFTTKPTTAGSLTAVVTTDKQSSGAAVQVATVTPVVTASTAQLPASATQITIKGLGFDATAANNTVAFNDGAVGTVMTASPTALTVTFSTRPTTAGSLTSIVTTDKQSSGAAVQVATVTPVVTASTANLAASATQIAIKGLGFDPAAANNTVTFNDGAVGTVMTASPTALTVTFSTRPITAGSLTAVVTTDKQSSGAAVQVATVTPVVTASTAQLPASATQITINGLGFDPTAANNTVTFNDGAAGTVTKASPTSLAVTLTTKPTTSGSLTAVVTTDKISSGTAVQVATVTPVVTASMGHLAANAPQITINGFGFDPTAANNTVAFNDGAVGTVTTATPTSLIVNFSTKPTTAGSLTAVVTTDNQSSGAAVQVAAVTSPVTVVVSPSTANLAASAGQITIQGSGFDPTAVYDTVTFNDGAVGSVTAATSTALTVTLSTRPTAAGSLTAIVHSDGVSSGSAVQVATVAPVVTASTAAISANPSQMTIRGFGFDSTAANNLVTFNLSAHGTVTAATPTSLTVTFTGRPATVGTLTAVVITDNVTSGAPVQVATVTPVVTASTASLAASATQITINGLDFDATAADNTVAFNDGAAGTVITATATALTVNLTSRPTTAGSLTAVVSTDKISSGTAVQVATVTPVVTASTANLAANAPRSPSTASASIRPPPITRSRSTTAPLARSRRPVRPR